MSELIVYKPDFGGYATEYETDLVLAVDTPEDVFYNATAGKIQEAGRIYWHIGAALHYGYNKYRDEVYEKLHAMTGWTVGTLKTIRSVYKSTRDYAVPGLSFWVHKEAAALPEPIREKFLGEAQDSNWTVETAKQKSAQLRGMPSSKKPAIEISQSTDNNNRDAGVIEAEFHVIEPEDSIRMPKELAQALAAMLSRVPNLNEQERDACARFEALAGVEIPRVCAPALSSQVTSNNSITPRGKERGVGERKPKPVEIHGKEQIREFDNLDNDEFRAAWADWHQQRRDLGKKITPLSACEQLKWLSGQRDPIACIRYTIMKGWQGLKAPEPRGGNTVQSLSAKMLSEAGFAQH